MKIKRPLKVVRTEKGFPRIDFNDTYSEACHIQMSSVADYEAIWIGTNKRSMHLTREQVDDLLPYLIEFANNGALTKDTIRYISIKGDKVSRTLAN